jgi:hypothetical protein
LTTTAELRPGDSAAEASVGSFATGDFSVDDSSLITIDVDPTLGIADVIDVSGTLQLAGTLRLNLFSMPTFGQSFLILDNDLDDSVIGSFASGGGVSGLFGGQSYRFAIDYAAGTGNDISITAIPEPGTLVALVAAASVLSLGRRRGANGDRTHRCGTSPMVLPV